MSIRGIFDRCRSAAIEIKMIDSMLEHVGSIGSHACDCIKTDQFESMQSSLENRKREIIGMTHTAYVKICELDDCIVRSIMCYYYIMGYSDEKISDVISMSRETITRKRNKALDYLDRLE